MLVAALVRRVEQIGGSAAVLSRGDGTAGAVLVQLAERGRPGALVERTLDAAGRYRWTAVGPDDATGRSAYIVRRQRVDPDLWVVELDHEGAAALLDEVTGLI